MSSAWDVCPHYFKMFSACPTVPFSDFEERPGEFITSLWMALVSSNQVWDLILVIILAGSLKNRINFLIAYLTPVIITSQILKPFFKGPRPPLSCIHAYGMPSGHSTAAGAIFIALIVLYQNRRIKSFNFTVIYAALMVNEAYSRIYLHYHTVHQVIYGFAFGFTSALILFHFFPITPPKTNKKYHRVEVMEHQYSENILQLQSQRYESLMI